MALSTEEIARIDAEIARYEGLRNNIRTAISEIETNGVSRATFEGREINYLPLSELKDSEGRYTILINQLEAVKAGKNFIFGNTIRLHRESIFGQYYNV